MFPSQENETDGVKKKKKKGEEKWDAYITAKQKGQTDLLLSQLGPACYELSTATTTMCTYTHKRVRARTQTEIAINQAD